MRQSWMVILLLSIIAAPSPTGAQEISAAGDTEKALREVLTKCRAFLAEKPAYEVSVKSRWESGSAKEMTTGEKDYRLLVVRPANVLLTMSSPPAKTPDLEVVGDGKTLLTHMPSAKLFSISAMPGARAGLEKNVVIAQSLIGSGLEIIARPDAPTFVLAQVSNIIDRGEEELRDIKGRHFSVTWGEARVQLWFTPGDQPLLSRFKRSSKLAAADGTTYEMEMSSDLTWNFKPEVNAETFRTTPPKNAQKVRDLYHHLSGEEASVALPDASAVELVGLDGQAKAWPKEKETLVLITASWDSDSPALIERFARGKTDFPRMVVIVADDVEQAKKGLLKSPVGVEVFVDRKGELPAALLAEELPIVLRVKDEKAVWQQAVDPATIDAAIEKGSTP